MLSEFTKISYGSVPSEGFETYSFGTVFVFSIPRKLGTRKYTQTFRVLGRFALKCKASGDVTFVPSEGFEPPTTVPKTGMISISLRGRDTIINNSAST